MSLCFPFATVNAEAAMDALDVAQEHIYDLHECISECRADGIEPTQAYKSLCDTRQEEHMLLEYVRAHGGLTSSYFRTAFARSLEETDIPF